MNFLNNRNIQSSAPTAQIPTAAQVFNGNIHLQQVAGDLSYSFMTTKRYFIKPPLPNYKILGGQNYPQFQPRSQKVEEKYSQFVQKGKWGENAQTYVNPTTETVYYTRPPVRSVTDYSTFKRDEHWMQKEKTIYNLLKKRIPGFEENRTVFIPKDLDFKEKIINCELGDDDLDEYEMEAIKDTFINLNSTNVLKDKGRSATSSRSVIACASIFIKTMYRTAILYILSRSTDPNDKIDAVNPFPLQKVKIIECVISELLYEYRFPPESLFRIVYLTFYWFKFQKLQFISVKVEQSIRVLLKGISNSILYLPSPNVIIWSTHREEMYDYYDSNSYDGLKYITYMESAVANLQRSNTNLVTASEDMDYFYDKNKNVINNFKILKDIKSTKKKISVNKYIKRKVVGKSDFSKCPNVMEIKLQQMMGLVKNKDIVERIIDNDFELVKDDDVKEKRKKVKETSKKIVELTIIQDQIEEISFNKKKREKKRKEIVEIKDKKEKKIDQTLGSLKDNFEALLNSDEELKKQFYETNRSKSLTQYNYVYRTKIDKNVPISYNAMRTSIEKAADYNQFKFNNESSETKFGANFRATGYNEKVIELGVKEHGKPGVEENKTILDLGYWNDPIVAKKYDRNSVMKIYSDTYYNVLNESQKIEIAKKIEKLQKVERYNLSNEYHKLLLAEILVIFKNNFEGKSGKDIIKFLFKNWNKMNTTERNIIEKILINLLEFETKRGIANGIQLHSNLVYPKWVNDYLIKNFPSSDLKKIKEKYLRFCCDNFDELREKVSYDIVSLSPLEWFWKFKHFFGVKKKFADKTHNEISSVIWKKFGDRVGERRKLRKFSIALNFMVPLMNRTFRKIEGERIRFLQSNKIFNTIENAVDLVGLSTWMKEEKKKEKIRKEEKEKIKKDEKENTKSGKKRKKKSSKSEIISIEDDFEPCQKLRRVIVPTNITSIRKLTEICKVYDKN